MKRNVPSPFKRSLIWPEKVTHNEKKLSNKKSPLLTSEKYQQDQAEIEEEKLKKK